MTLWIAVHLYHKLFFLSSDTSDGIACAAEASHGRAYEITVCGMVQAKLKQRCFSPHNKESDSEIEGERKHLTY